MTDNEIKKALECHRDERNSCRNCPYREVGCSLKLTSDALDLINRKDEEIVRLQNILLAFMDEVAKWEAKKGIDVSELPLIPICDEGRDIIDHYRAKAVKEFMDRLIDVAVCKDNGDGTERLYVSTQKIREVAKEKVGDKDES